MPAIASLPTAPAQNVFSMSGTTVTTAPNDVLFSNANTTQHVLIQGNMLVMYSPTLNAFYTIALPDNYNSSDQIVGVF